MANPTAHPWNGKAPESWDEVAGADPMLDPSPTRPRSEPTVPMAMEGPSTRFLVVDADEHPPTQAGSSLVHSAQEISRPHSNSNSNSTTTWSFLRVTGNLVHAVLASAGNGTADAAHASDAVFRLIWTGLLAILLPPAIVVAAALAAAGVILCGCGHVLEGVGRGLTIGSERLWRRVSAAGETKRLVRVVQAGWQEAQAQASDVERGGGGIAI